VSKPEIERAPKGGSCPVLQRPHWLAEDAVGSELVSTVEFSGITGQNTGENRKIGAKITTISSTNADSIRVSSEIPRKK
jgi:hypothetical protein